MYKRIYTFIRFALAYVYDAYAYAYTHAYAFMHAYTQTHTEILQFCKKYGEGGYVCLLQSLALERERPAYVRTENQPFLK